MTTEDYENALNKLQEKYEETLVAFGRKDALCNRYYDRASYLSDQVDQLTTRNKSLTKQLHNARVKLYYFGDTTPRIIEMLSRARQISPEVAARIDEIKDEVNRIYNQRKSQKKA